MARMRTLTVLFASFALSGCDHYASMEGVTPNIPAARFNAQVGISYLKQGDTGAAQSRLQLAKAQAPNDPLVLDALGYYYEVTGDVNTANSYYSGAMIAAPDSGTVINTYGAFLCRQGYYGTSIPYFIRAAKTHYAQADHAYGNARYCLEMLHTTLGERSDYAYYNKLLWKTSSIPTDKSS